MDTTRITRLMLAFAIGSVLLASSSAAQKRDMTPAPTPTQLTASKKIFVSNAGGDTNSLYTGSAERLYNQFYVAVKNWGRYELVGSPAEAELVFEVSFSNPFTGQNIYGGSGNIPINTKTLTDPHFTVRVIDVGTRMTLWVFTQHIEPALLESNRDKNFDQALARLVNDIRNVAGQPAAISAKQ